MSLPSLRIIIIVETARLCVFLHASKKEMNSLNDDNDIWQIEVYDQEQYTIYCHDWEQLF